MGFLDSLLTKRIDTEKSWLKELRTATETWFNQLTDPLLPLLLDQINPHANDQKEKYQVIADGLLKEAFIINAGNAVNNLFQEMGERGLPFVTSRQRLAPLIQDYLESGLFLKRIAYGFDPKVARNQRQQFCVCKDKLIAEINNQLRRIG